jgi:hypothetical protein
MIANYDDKTFIVQVTGVLAPSKAIQACLPNVYHRNKTRVQMPVKNVSSFEIIMFAVYGPHSWS